LSLPLVEYLLQADAVLGIHPHGHLQKVLSNCGVFRYQFQLFSLNAVQRLRATIGDVPFFGKLFAAGAKAKQKIAAELVVLVGCYLVGKFLVQAENAF